MQDQILLAQEKICNIHIDAHFLIFSEQETPKEQMMKKFIEAIEQGPRRRNRGSRDNNRSYNR